MMWWMKIGALRWMFAVAQRFWKRWWKILNRIILWRKVLRIRWGINRRNLRRQLQSLRSSMLCKSYVCLLRFFLLVCGGLCMAMSVLELFFLGKKIVYVEFLVTFVICGVCKTWQWTWMKKIVPMQKHNHGHQYWDEGHAEMTPPETNANIVTPTFSRKNITLHTFVGAFFYMRKEVE